jgi:hypothetical protein
MTSAGLALGGVVQRFEHRVDLLGGESRQIRAQVSHEVRAVAAVGDGAGAAARSDSGGGDGNPCRALRYAEGWRAALWGVGGRLRGRRNLVLM